jgi:hypothetical protein
MGVAGIDAQQVMATQLTEVERLLASLFPSECARALVTSEDSC